MGNIKCTLSSRSFLGKKVLFIAYIPERHFSFKFFAFFLFVFALWYPFFCRRCQKKTFGNQWKKKFVLCRAKSFFGAYLSKVILMILVDLYTRIICRIFKFSWHFWNVSKDWIQCMVVSSLLCWGMIE